MLIILYFTWIIICFVNHGMAAPIWSNKAGSKYDFRSPYNGNTSQPLLQLWSFSVGGFIDYPAIGSDGSIFISSRDNYLYALTGRGTLKWKSSFLYGGTTALGYDGILYVCDGALSALNESTGKILWRNNTSPYNFYGYSTVSIDGVIYAGMQVSGPTVSFISAINGTSGKTIWDRVIGDRITASPALDEKNDALYIMELNLFRRIYSLNRTNGNLIWNISVCTQGGQITLTADDTLYAKCGTNVFAIRKSTGAVIWTYSTGATSMSSPALGIDIVYVIGAFSGPGTGVLYAINMTNGSLIWTFVHTESGDTSSPVIAGDGTVYFRSYTKGNVYALNGSTGVLKWRFIINDEGGSSLSIGSDGTIYSASGYTLYALKHTACPVGSYWNPENLVISPSSICSVCPPGSYNDQAGLVSDCPLCPVGSYSFTFGHTKCLPCSGGTYSSSIGSTVCEVCPIGTFSSIIGAESISNCSSCPVGTYSSTPGSTSCTLCSSGTYNPTVGNFSKEACLPCPIGTYNLLLGQGSLTSCQACLPGTFNPSTGKSECNVCPAGTFGNISGATSINECIPCPAGTYNSIPGQIQSACIPCLPGSYSNVSGATSVEICKICPVGYYSIAGSAACEPCRPGTYQDRVGSSVCIPCPRSTYSMKEAAISSNTCINCPNGQNTLSVGSVLITDCYEIPFSCPAGTQLANKNARTCIPLICPNYLQSTPNGCLGCTKGTYGNWGSCFPCPSDKLCPGLLSKPLSIVNNSWSCTIDQIMKNINNPLTASTNAGENSESDLVGRYLIPVIIGIMIIIFTTILNFTAYGRKVLKYIDAFALSHTVDDGHSPIKNRTGLGGTCTLFAATTISVIAIVLILMRNNDNILKQASLSVLDNEALQSLETATWAETAGLSGFQLYLTIQGESVSSTSNCTAPMSIFDSGLKNGKWIFSTRSNVCDGKDVSLLTFSCSDCIFSPTSLLQLIFPYSCQSILVDAIAIDASGSVRTIHMPSSEEMGVSFLTSLSWELAPLLSIQNDNFTNQRTKGYQLVGLTSSSTFETSATLIKPAESTIQVNFKLTLQSFYSITTLSEKISKLQLLSSIIGLSGIFSAFGLLFQVTYRRKSMTLGNFKNILSKKSNPLTSFSDDDPKSTSQNNSYDNITKYTTNRDIQFAAGTNVNYHIVTNPLVFDQIVADQSSVITDTSNLANIRTPPPTEIFSQRTVIMNPYDGQTHESFHKQAFPAVSTFNTEQHNTKNFETTSKNTLVEPINSLQSKWYRHDDGHDVWYTSEDGSESVWEPPENSLIIDSRQYYTTDNIKQAK